MSVSSYVLSTRLARRVARMSVAALAIASLGATQFASVANADAWWRPPLRSTALSSDPGPQGFEPFDATGLPAGAARGIPQRATLPPGFNLKHVHGGPSYVYVISGSLDIIDADGKTTYRAGDFFWEPVGRVHTAQTAERAELFILRFLTPGAEGTVPVQ